MRSAWWQIASASAWVVPTDSYGTPDDRIAQGPQFSLALGGVAGWEIPIDIAWMAAQLGDAFLDLRLQHSYQALHADLLQMGRTTPLPIELREIVNWGVFPQRQAVVPRQIKEMGEQPWVVVEVVVGVQMGW